MRSSVGGMALLTCPDCGNQVSTSASGCPHCGNRPRRLHQFVQSITPWEAIIGAAVALAAAYAVFVIAAGAT